MTSEELAQVSNFSITAPNLGSVRWLGKTDVRGLDLDSIVNIENRNVTVYPKKEQAPPRGQGLNKPAVISFYNVYPKKQKYKTDLSRYKNYLKRKCEEMGGEFLDYKEGECSFQVEHFSGYSLSDSSHSDSIDSDEDLNLFGMQDNDSVGSFSAEEDNEDM
eukprot:TRINITY_DN12390_c0_g1_i1.p1 TRINITY_DN12390_c0_g1~~TRINITY_DN12390_c0_g1_i1.p1  ORF type:complete len:175 (+),score=41.95 TRINITY_DN12390_c0_g1_i1:43-525(+)